MKALLLILTAFFLQSCYTILYTPNEYSETGDVWFNSPPEPVIIHTGPRPVYFPAPPPENEDPAAEQQEVRLRNDDQARDRIYGTFPDQRPVRIRTETAPTNPTPAATAVDEAATGNSNNVNAPADNPARLRTPSTQPAQSQTRERTASRTQQDDTSKPRSR